MERVDVLERRVRWLDRYRRLLAGLAALCLGPLLTNEFGEIAGDEWPVAHLAMLGITLVAVIWLMLETVLAAVAALWETEHDELSRARGLPAARVLRRR